MRSKKRTAQIAVTALMAAATAIMAQISIPLASGVPITLQTFGIALCGYILGSRPGAISVAVYIALGAVGLPVFASFKGGIHVLFGPTGGFIWGFIVLALLSGLGAKVKNTKSKYICICGILFGFAGLIICHLTGAAQYSVVSGITFYKSLTLVSLPFLLKDLISVATACAFANALKKRIKLKLI